MEKRKVLVIDDYPTMLKLIRYYLERKGCQVFTAASLEEGWQIFERERPQAYSLDLFVGAIKDTLAFVWRVRQADKNILCLAITREPDNDGTIERFENCGVARVFFKSNWNENHEKFFSLLAGEVKPYET